MNLTGMMMALVVIALISSLSLSMYGSLSTTYSVNVPTTLAGKNTSLQTFDKSQDIIELTKRMEANETGIAGALKGIPIFGEIGSITLAGVQILTLLFEVPGMFAAMISDTVAILGLPGWIGSLAIAAITILIIMTIVSALVRWGGTA